jgi:hypothetical protein
MANVNDGMVLCEHISDVLNTLIKNKGTQIRKDESVIWDEFLHVINNQEWADMFAAFEQVIETHKIFLTEHQERKYQEAKSQFTRDQYKRERCMDIRNRFMNTKDKAWAMIMVIREVFNDKNNRNIPNVDREKPKPQPVTQPGKRRRINVTATIEIWEDLFEVK